MNPAQEKVTSIHLKRKAYLYIRQSTMHQVFENTESTKRQYALQEQAIAMGWPVEQVIVIDTDQGQSGASAANRVGFQRLVMEVGMGNAGIVLGLEVSRLARNNANWHHLLQICALTNTLIMDEDGIYDPCQFNDRLLLGLKGTMSEAELHILRARLRGGTLNKARRGELKVPLPVGFVYDVADRVVIDPDQRIQQSFRLLFQTFYRTGTINATEKAFRIQGLKFPIRIHGGPCNGELVWGPLRSTKIRRILYNPRYAGAFFYGMTRSRRTADGKKHQYRVPREEWYTLINDAHPGYITWDEYNENVGRLRENAKICGADRRNNPPREGPALLQGIVICGICGSRMGVRYHTHNGCPIPEYICDARHVENGKTKCQIIHGKGVDKAIGELLLEIVTPMTLEIALAVQQELLSRVEEIDRLHLHQVEHARYEVDIAQRRYMKVDPDNRLVASALESEWNDKLRALSKAKEECERQRQDNRLIVSEEQKKEVLGLATDFPRLWCDPNTPDRERKRMTRLLIEDVTLTKRDKITMQIRFRGGACKTKELPVPLRIWQAQRTSPVVVQEVDELLNQHHDAEIATILNEKGCKTGCGKEFRSINISIIRKKYGLVDRFTRLREAGMMTSGEIAPILGIAKRTVEIWRRRGILRAYAYTDNGNYLYEPPGDDPPRKFHLSTLKCEKDLSPNSMCCNI